MAGWEEINSGFNYCLQNVEITAQLSAPFTFRCQFEMKFENFES